MLSSFKFLMTLMCLFSFHGYTEVSAVSSTQINSMISYLRVAPARISGQVSSGKTVMLAEGAVGVRLNQGFPIQFDVTENSLSLNMRAGSPGAITILVLGIPVKVNSVSYGSNGRFSADVSTPGGGPIERAFESRVAEELEKKFKTKMVTAFARLRSIRNQRTIGDIGEVIDSIKNILLDDPTRTNRSEYIPLSGQINVEIEPPQNRTMNVGSLAMELKRGDNISAGVTFNNRGNLFNVDAIELTSRLGIVVHPDHVPAVDPMSAMITRINIDSNGMTPTYLSGPEQAAGGIRLILQTLFAYQGASNLADCTDLRIAPLQNWLNCQLNGELVPIVRENLEVLRAARVSPQVIQVLLNPPSTAENCNYSRPLAR